MSGLKTSFVDLYDVNLNLVNLGTNQDGSSKGSVPMILFKFMQFLAAMGAPYDQAKTLDGKFILSSKNKVELLTNVVFFNNVSFPQSEHFLVTAIRVLSGAAATAAAASWTPGVSDALTQNGSFSIINSNNTEMSNIPLESFPLSTNTADEDAGFLALEKGILWKGQTFLTAPATWATAPSTSNQCLNIQLWGMKLV